MTESAQLYVDKADMMVWAGRRVGQILTLADKMGMGGMDSPFMANTICEQPLILKH